MASSVSHDSHNCICVGVNDEDMVRAMNTVREMGGGFAVSFNGELKTLPLPIAGLMSDLSFEVEISFFALPVIPKIRVTDFGLVDVENMKLVDLWIE